MVFFLGLAFALYSPIGTAVLVGCYLVFNYYRVSHKVIAGVAALYCVPYFAGVALFSSASAMFDRYHTPIRDLLAAIGDKKFDGYLSAHWWDWFAAQLWFSLALGLMLGSAWTWWKWIRRPVWEDNERIPGPIHRWKRRRVIQRIAADLDGPADGATLGVDKYGARIVQTEDEAKAHTLVAGGSGAGKSTTMMIGIRDAIRRGEPVCVVDLKGATDVPARLAEWSQRYGRRFLHWSITDRRTGYHGPADGPAFYDPIGRGDPSRKKDLLIGSEKWDVEYYKSVNENYLQIAFQIAEMVPNADVDAFTDLAALLDLDKLRDRACTLFLNQAKTPEGQQHAAAYGKQSQWWHHYHTVLDPYASDLLGSAAGTIIKPEESERSAIRNMAARVQKLRQSTAGHWLKRDPEYGRDIDLRRAADEGWVVVFSLDSSNYEQTSAQVGGLIIQDLKTLSSELRVKPAPHPFHIYVDEFSAIGSDNIIGMLARARDARMPTTLSTQALGDLRKVDHAFLDQVLGIVNCFILHRTNQEEDANVFAGLTGKKLVYVKRYGVEMASGLPGGIGTGSATGQGHIEQQEDYVVPASGFQSLKVGELVYIAKSPQNRVVHPVTVIREDANAMALAMVTGDAPLIQQAPTRPASPFAPTEDDNTEFPSPWPVVAPQPTTPAAVPVPAEDVQDSLEPTRSQTGTEPASTSGPGTHPVPAAAPAAPSQPNHGGAGGMSTPAAAAGPTAPTETAPPSGAPVPSTGYSDPDDIPDFDMSTPIEHLQQQASGRPTTPATPAPTAAPEPAPEPAWEVNPGPGQAVPAQTGPAAPGSQTVESDEHGQIPAAFLDGAIPAMPRIAASASTPQPAPTPPAAPVPVSAPTPEAAALPAAPTGERAGGPPQEFSFEASVDWEDGAGSWETE